MIGHKDTILVVLMERWKRNIQIGTELLKRWLFEEDKRLRKNRGMGWFGNFATNWRKIKGKENNWCQGYRMIDPKSCQCLTYKYIHTCNSDFFSRKIQLILKRPWPTILGFGFDGIYIYEWRCCDGEDKKYVKQAKAKGKMLVF